MNSDRNIEDLADMHINQLKNKAESLPMEFIRDYIEKLKAKATIVYAQIPSEQSGRDEPE